MTRHLVVGCIVASLLLGFGVVPASAVSDTTPPSLVSVTVSPGAIDVSNSSQDITITAVITDDLSGVSTDSNVEVDSPSGDQGWYEYFDLISGDTYSATITIPRYSEAGIWRDWYFELWDNAANSTVFDGYELLQQGINIAFGVQDFADSYSRNISLKLSRTRAAGYVNATLASACFWYIPVTLERKTASGWRKIGTQLSSFMGHYSFHIRKAGKYRTTAEEFPLGTPTVTTCLKASIHSSIN
jgi:hypothetical protein